MSRSNLSPSEEPDAGRENQSQTVTAVLRLRELVLSGQFEPGERMAEIPLATRLSVSRTPLRLALTTLQHEGLLELHPTRGFVVRAFTLSDIYDSIEIRGVLEGTAARFAAERLAIDPARARQVLAKLKHCVSFLDEAVHSSAANMESLTHYIEGNGRFHALFLQLAQSEPLAREMERIVCLPFASPNSGFLLIQTRIAASREILQIGQYQHKAILDAIERREGARAEALVREHSRLARRNLEIALNDDSLRHLVPGSSLIRDVDAEEDLMTAEIAVMPGSRRQYVEPKPSRAR